MGILIKKEPLFPSVTKPGIYFYDSEVEFFIDGEGNQIPISWDQLSGIDFNARNRFRFAIGTWTEVSRNNRAIKIYPSNQMDFINLGLQSEPVEPKPTSPPDGFLENTEENALQYEPKPPAESYNMYSGERIPPDQSDLDFSGFGDDFDPMFNPSDDTSLASTANIIDSDGNLRPNYTIYVGRDRYDDISVEQSLVIVGTDDKRGGWVKGGVNWYEAISPYHSFGGTQRTHKVIADDFPFHNEQVLTSAHPQFKLYNVTEENDYFAGLTDFERKKVGRGYWRVDGLPKRKESGEWTAKVSKFFRGIGNLVKNIVASGSWKTYNNIYFEYEWVPNLDNIPFLNREGAYHIPSFEWKWTGKEWIPSETLLAPPQVKQPDNEFLGVPIISNEKPNMLNALAFEDSDPSTLPLLHDSRFPNFNKTTAPLKLWFSMSFFKQDMDELFNSNVYKFHVFEWGDEEDQLSVEDLMLSEFFALYDTDEDGFSREQAKRLIQVVKRANYFTDEDSKLNFLDHTYLTSGVKTIRTLIFRLSGDETTLYETTLVSTNVNIGDAGDSLLDFNIFGASDFNVLPIELEKPELIIGSIDKDSDYVNSLKQINKDDVYGSKDYLEKNHIEKFIPQVEKSMYGEHIGKLDLSTTRMFNKPYDLSYFINSSVTDILIDDNTCIVELSPSSYNKVGVALENTSNSNERGVLVGDYKLVKEANQELKKDDFMEIPKLNKKHKDQAF